MIKKVFSLIFVIITSVTCARAQQDYADSLKQALQSAGDEPSKIKVLGLLSSYYNNLYPDSGIYYAEKMIAIAEQSGDNYGMADALIYKSGGLLMQTKYPEALKTAYDGLKIAEKLKESRQLMIGKTYRIIGELNSRTGKDSAALVYTRNAFNLITQSSNKPEDIFSIYCLLGRRIRRNQPDSSIIYAKRGYELFRLAKNNRRLGAIAFYSLGVLYFERGLFYRHRHDTIKAAPYYDSAFKYTRAGIKFCKDNNTPLWLGPMYQLYIFNFYNLDRPDSSLYYARQLLDLSIRYNYKSFLDLANGALSQIYQHYFPNKDSAIKYLQATLNAKDSISNMEKNDQFQQIAFNEVQRQKDLLDQKKEFQTQLKLYAMLAVILLVLLVAFFLYRSYRTKQRDFNLLQLQKKETDNQKNIAVKALEELKSTQAQLIQTEKMASLGELTAGIAHEIQNPLNFVNNFSEVNKEMLEELKAERLKPKAERDDQTEDEILNDVIANEEKINHHGKRADAIVKGMLQHSRSSTGHKELTDINALTDEYLRLSYHGLRAKDKLFNATLQTDFDETIGNINIIPQDIGRVLLNFYNNAFYALNEKQKAESNVYEPIVLVSTKKLNNSIEIKVSDNGNGIPQKIIDKIFQPFFTTKPTGQGTGLGLSLAYDIVKAHGGEIKVESMEGEGTIICIVLPI